MKYQDAGVDIEAGNKAIDLIKKSVSRTFNDQVLGHLGGFAAGFEIPPHYKKPVLVSCTDGVGTKLALSIELKKYDTVGIDLVAMCVNDLVCMGAQPLFFLDYIACHKLIPEQAKDLVDGMVQGCLESNCALVGGEMAEMNDLYREGDFDLAGFCVGVVEKDDVLTPDNITEGCHLYALASSGIHSNGYSLVRKVLTQDACKRHGIDRQSLLIPTKIYVKQALELIQAHDIRGLAHITGGGLLENLARILPKNVDAVIDQSALQIPPIFDILQKEGVSEDEMYKVFNMGVGMVVVSQDKLEEDDQTYYIGKVTHGSGRAVFS